MTHSDSTRSWLCTTCAVLVGLALGNATAEEFSGLDTAVDRDLFPRAYGVLANERLMFPVDMGDWPVRIDAAHQLFVDDYLIAAAEKLKRTVHQAVKHPDNPIVVGDKAWEGAGPVFPIVRRDANSGRFRMWYSGAGSYTLPSGVSVRFPTLYAESDDGVQWEKPALGLHPYADETANNIVIPGGNLYGLHIDADEPDPARRYKGIVWHEPQYVPREGYYLYTSPDGIHWNRAREQPLALSLHGYTMPQSGIGDTSIFRWDRRLRKYVGDVKFVLPGKMRCRGTMESDDLVHWTRPRMTVYPDAVDDPDSQIYAQLSFCYESMWLGFLRVMHTDRTKGYKQTTVELTASRDGRHWYRVGGREEILPLGAEAEWDTDYHEPSWPPLLVDDELWIYYRSCKLRRDETRRYALGLAKMRRDGFVSIGAGEEPGTLTTRPLSFAGKSLWINAEVAADGWIRAAVVNAEGDAVAEQSLDDCVGVTRGSLAARMTWKHTDLVECPAEGHLRLRFQLRRAKLYAFWIE